MQLKSTFGWSMAYNNSIHQKLSNTYWPQIKPINQCRQFFNIHNL